MFNSKDEYAEATEKASINQHGKRAIGGYKLGILNLFLLTTIGVMGYVGFDSLTDKRIDSGSVENKIDTTDSDLLDILSNIDVDESKKESKSLSLEINSIVNESTSDKKSSYTKALSAELRGY